MREAYENHPTNSSKSDHSVFKIYILNNFPFNSINYLQIKEYVIDTIFDPVCTNTISVLQILSQIL